MRDLRRHREKHHCSLMSLTPTTFDANTFSCCGGSYYATIAVFIIICRRPLSLTGPHCPHHCRWFLPRPLPLAQSMFLCRIVFYLYHSAPEGTAVVYINNSHIFSSGLHEHGACPPRLYTFVYSLTPWG
jgi:hypothetical protein